MVYFFQLVAYRGNTVVGASPVKTVCAKTDWEASSLAEAVGYRPVLDKGYEGITTTAIGRESSGARLYFFQETLNFTVQAVAPDSYKLLCGCYFVTTQYTGTGEEIRTGAQYNRAVDFGAINPTFTQPGVGDSAAEYYEGRLYESTLTFTSASSMRSGAIIPASQLLTSAHTPAEYLVSFAKTFGLLFVYDNAEKKVSLVPRNGFFTGEVMDLTNRVQRLKEVTITPQVRSAKWYVFDPSTAEGDFAKEYKSVYGVDYGAQKVDTGYEFDAADQKLLDGYAFRGAAAVLKNGPYWNMIFDGTGFRPSPFVDKGNQYTMWSVPGDTHSFPVPCPPSSVTVNYYNIVSVGYDLPAYPKLDLVDDKGNAVDGVDILVYYGGFGSYPYFKITDDDEAMVACNDGKPCWNLNPGTAAGVGLPCFTRYADFVPDGTVTRSLDFGIPRELDIPRIAISPTLGSLYLRYWQAYLSDRLHTDTKVLKCRVDFSGLQVGQGLLRKFFYYQGAYWVLNKITNYSLTTYDPTECELVQVQDMGNYTNGQTL
jgi:hypothetical protein